MRLTPLASRAKRKRGADTQTIENLPPRPQIANPTTAQQRTAPLGVSVAAATLSGMASTKSAGGAAAKAKPPEHSADQTEAAVPSKPKSSIQEARPCSPSTAIANLCLSKPKGVADTQWCLRSRLQMLGIDLPKSDRLKVNCEARLNKWLQGALSEDGRVLFAIASVPGLYARLQADGQHLENLKGRICQAARSNWTSVSEADKVFVVRQTAEIKTHGIQKLLVDLQIPSIEDGATYPATTMAGQPPVTSAAGAVNMARAVNVSGQERKEKNDKQSNVSAQPIVIVIDDDEPQAAVDGEAYSYLGKRTGRLSPGSQPVNTVQDSKEWSLFERVEALGMIVPKVSKICRLRRRDSILQNEVIKAWARNGFKENGFTIFSLLNVGLVCERLPSSKAGSNAANQTLKQVWDRLTDEGRSVYEAQNQDILTRGMEALAAIFSKDLAVRWPIGIHVRLGVLCDGSGKQVSFPLAAQRHRDFSGSQLEELVNNYSEEKLSKIRKLFHRIGQGLFDFHAYPIICQLLNKISADLEVARLANEVWQRLVDGHQNEWKDASMELRDNCRNNNPRGLYLLLKNDTSEQMGPTEDHHTLAFQHIMSSRAIQGVRRRAAFTLPGAVSSDRAVVRPSKQDELYDNTPPRQLNARDHVPVEISSPKTDGHTTALDALVPQSRRSESSESLKEEVLNALSSHIRLHALCITRGRMANNQRIDYDPSAAGVTGIASKLQALPTAKPGQQELDVLLRPFVLWNSSQFFPGVSVATLQRLGPAPSGGAYGNTWRFFQNAQQKLGQIDKSLWVEKVQIVFEAVRSRYQEVLPGSDLLKAVDEASEDPYNLARIDSGFGLTLKSCFDGPEVTLEEYEDRFEAQLFAFVSAHPEAAFTKQKADDVGSKSQLKPIVEEEEKVGDDDEIQEIDRAQFLGSWTGGFKSWWPFARKRKRD